MESCHTFKIQYRLILLWFLLLITLLNPRTVAYSLDLEDASTLIQTGENALASTFKNVLTVDIVGANVSNLIRKLNEAAELLETAKVSLGKGQLDNVLALTSHLSDLLKEVNEEAEVLRLSTLAQRESEFRFNLLLMLVGCSGFSIFMMLLWRWFKGYYLRELNLKPEVSKVVEP